MRDEDSLLVGVGVHAGDFLVPITPGCLIRDEIKVPSQIVKILIDDPTY